MLVARRVRFRHSYDFAMSSYPEESIANHRRMNGASLVSDGQFSRSGRAIVEAGLAAGNKVLATARDIESLHDLPERHGNQVKLFALDVTNESAAASAVQTAISALGALEVVINNAGYGNLSSVEDTPMSDFREQIETNLFGTIIVTKAALPYFRQRKAGHFVEFSSMVGRIGPPGRGPYSAAK